MKNYTKNKIDSTINLRKKFLIESGKILKLSLPILIAQIGVVATGFLDTMMAGNFHDDALAGVAIGSSFCFPLILATNGFLMAVTPITAQLAGADKYQKIGVYIRNALVLGLICALVITLLVNQVSPILKLMKLSPQVTKIVKDYITGISYGFPAVAIYFALKSFTEGIGKTKPQMFIAVIAVTFNYFANDILIHGKYGFPVLGGAGCGWASAITFWIFLIFMLMFVSVDKTCRKCNVFSNITLPSFSITKELIKLGLPIGGTIFMECSIFACITLFIGVLGPVIVDSHQIALNFSGIIFSLPLSISMALTIRTGFEIGAGNPGKARFSSITGTVLAVLFSFLTMLFTFVFPEFIAGIYTKNDEIIKIAASLLVTGALYQFSDSIMITAQGSLRGYKDAKMTMFLTFLAYWTITLPLGYTLSMTDLIIPRLGAKGFWISLIVGLSISGILLSFRLNKVSLHFLKKS
ncbi:MAG: MATE family efflux transporter [Desulfobacterales bacterium]|nr:MATE family efflux transporter [Desulfobacterales bacterium]MCP4161597.1 MATE family efflux transporter [Deltaproteobacteria bacterium]